MTDSFLWSIVVFEGIVGAGEEGFTGSFVSFESIAVSVITRSGL